MKFGIREVCDVTFKKLSGNGPNEFTIDTAKMTTLEGASTTVYAQGGKGNSRLMAWEGEKTLTFTVEDALITLDSFHALTGTEKTVKEGKTIFTSKTTSFAGYYGITAKTLFRDENGEDHDATIKIPKAKLQTQLNLSMAPSGDPSTFTFTFDAFPKDSILFEIEIDYAATSFKVIDGTNNYGFGSTLINTTFVGTGKITWTQHNTNGAVAVCINGESIVENSAGISSSYGLSTELDGDLTDSTDIPVDVDKELPPKSEGYVYYWIDIDYPYDPDSDTGV